MPKPKTHSIVGDIRIIINGASERAVRLVDHERTMMYWKIGKRIFEEEQEGKDRADYGVYLNELISKQIEAEFGSGFSRRQIEIIRQFYRPFPIANTVYSQLSWSQYKLLIRIGSQDKKDFYLVEALKKDVSSRSQ